MKGHHALVMSGHSKNLAGSAFIFMIGLFVFCCSILSLARGQLRANWFIYLVWGIIGVYILVASGNALFSAWKRPKFESVFPVSLPNSIIFTAPCEIHGGKTVIYLASSAKLYNGEITLFLRQKDSRLELGKAFLIGMKPSFRIPVPTWFKWLHVKEAGTTLDLWPRGTRGLSDPVIIYFNHPIAQGDTIELSLKVTSVLDKEAGGRRGNVRKSDDVTICFYA